MREILLANDGSAVLHAIGLADMRRHRPARVAYSVGFGARRTHICEMRAAVEPSLTIGEIAARRPVRAVDRLEVPFRDFSSS